MKTQIGDIWVLIETDERGAARNAGIALLNPGRAIANSEGCALVAVVLGANVHAAIDAASRHGADCVLAIDDESLALYTTDAYAAALSELARRYTPSAILIEATQNGRDLAPRVSCRLQTGLVADCTQLESEGTTGNIIWTRPAFGGNLMASIVCPNNRPQMGTVRSGVFDKPVQGAPCAKVLYESLHEKPVQARTRLLQIIAETTEETVDLESAEIIIAGGRGAGGPEGFAPIRALAEVLGADVGASRAAVDAGWIGHAHQVGQTGTTVKPRLYIACGISGAIQHVTGMRGADVIVAINRDADAPIFHIADYCVVGDMFTILPALTEKLRNGQA